MPGNKSFPPLAKKPGEPQSRFLLRRDPEVDSSGDITLIGLVFTVTGGPALATILWLYRGIVGAALFCLTVWGARFVAA